MQLISGTGHQKAAKTSRILIGPQVQPLTFASWEAALTGEDLSTVNFESWDSSMFGGGQTPDEGILGPVAVDLRFGGDWDEGADPTGDPPGLYVRDDLADLNFLPDRNGPAEPWDFPYARLRSATNGGTVRDKVTFQCSGKNQGPFTFPLSSD